MSWNLNIESLTILQFIILSLAAARVTRLVVVDAITQGLRNRVFKHFPVEGQQVPGPAPKGAHWTTTAINTSPIRWIVNKGSFVGELISCPWCAGFWITGAWWLSWVYAPSATVFFALPWALANIASFVTTKE